MAEYTDAEIAGVAQAMRDANTGEAWREEQGIPFATFTRAALDALVAAGGQPPDGVTDAEPDPPFCHACGHACGHNPPHRLVDTPDGPVCEDTTWCTQLRHADEARRTGVGELPGWVLELVAGLARYEHDHPKLYRYGGAEAWCPCHLLKGVPAEVRARTEREG